MWVRVRIIYQPPSCDCPEAHGHGRVLVPSPPNVLVEDHLNFSYIQIIVVRTIFSNFDYFRPDHFVNCDM